MHRLVLAAALALTATGAAAQPAVTPSWSGFRWRSPQITSLRTVNRLTSNWHGIFDRSVQQWNVAPEVELLPQLAASSATCSPLPGTIQVCNGNYGANGWLGAAQVWLSGGFIVQGTVRMNDFYFARARYNTGAFRQSVICHKLGHMLGLNQSDRNFTNRNTGSCMDYSNSPLGGGSWGPSNVMPGTADFRGLSRIYGGNMMAALVPETPMLAWSNLVIEGDGPDKGMMSLVPEPAQWLMLIAGFGLVGVAQRRRHLSNPMIAA